MTVTVCLPATEVISIDAMTSVETVVWWCLAMRPPGPRRVPMATVEHLTTGHHATIDTVAPLKPPTGCRLSPILRVQRSPH